MMKFSRLIALPFFLLYFATALAQTPDGSPPSEESVCDVLAAPDITPGLFGLCNAYCEAQDCDLYGALPQSCQSLLANYYRKKAESDPDLPCETSCPCWDGVDFGALQGDPVCTAGSAVFSSGESFVLTDEGCIYTDAAGQSTPVGPLNEAQESACLADIDFLCTD